MTFELERILWWLWFMPVLILLNAYNAAAELLMFIFESPTHAWEAATEAANL